MANDVFQSTTENNADPVAELVGEGKKFKTVADLAKGKQEADAFIEQLKAEQAALRAELDKKDSGQDQLAELRREVENLRKAAPQGSKEPTAPQLTVDGIQALVRETLTQAERNRTSQQNVSAANDAMVAHFGGADKAAEAVQAKARELGMSVIELRDIASKSPTAFQKIILGDTKVSDASPLNVREATPDAKVNNNASKPGTKEYFEAMRTSNDPKERKRYWTPGIQMQLHKAVKDGIYQL